MTIDGKDYLGFFFPIYIISKIKGYISGKIRE